MVETIASTLRASRIISIGNTPLEAPPTFGLCQPAYDTPQREAPVLHPENNSAAPEGWARHVGRRYAESYFLASSSAAMKPKVMQRPALTPMCSDG